MIMSCWRLLGSAEGAETVADMSQGRPKLTREQWEQLDIQFGRTPGLNDSFSASGEHYVLVALLNRFGYYPHSREAAIRLAQELLINGYET